MDPLFVWLDRFFNNCLNERKKRRKLNFWQFRERRCFIHSFIRVRIQKERWCCDGQDYDRSEWLSNCFTDMPSLGLSKTSLWYFSAIKNRIFQLPRLKVGIDCQQALPQRHFRCNYYQPYIFFVCFIGVQNLDPHYMHICYVGLRF